MQARISLLLGWEKRKRREAALTRALFYAFVAALAVPLFVSISVRWAWVAPLAIFIAVAPYLLFTQRWRERDTTRALAALDKALRLDERATTAWELAQRNETKPVAQLVLRQASDMLGRFDPRRLFPRAWGWHAWLLPPVIALWLALLYFDSRFETDAVAQRQAPALAQKLRELARELKEKAQSERLPKTLEAARALEKAAQRGLESGTSDEKFASEMAAMREKLAAQREASGEVPFGMPESRRALDDLRAELEVARESFAAGDEAQSWQERLAGLTQLRKQLDRQPGDARELSRSELKDLVDKLEQQVTAELDRRALSQAEQSLNALMQPGQSRHGNARGRFGASEGEDALAERPREDMRGSAPGSAPGQKSGAPSPPELQAARRDQVKGTIGEGERSATFFKAKPAPGKSRLAPEEVIASYQRQAEAELDTEQIPEPLKDTIKNYFLSLEKAK